VLAIVEGFAWDPRIRFGSFSFSYVDDIAKKRKV
jgi:hypothetical protein